MAYLFDNNWSHALERLRGLEAVEDAATQGHLEALGVARGWRCAEVGAGAGAIAAWLGQLVGETGLVVATDIDARFLRDLNLPNVEVREQNLEHAPLEPEAFDLVHLRHVLFHIQRARQADCVAGLVASLRPGGAILVEESDFASLRAEAWAEPAAAGLFDRVRDRILAVYASRGLDTRLGGRLVELLSAAGITGCLAEGRARCVRGGSAEAVFHRRTYEQLREAVLALGGCSSDDYDAFLALHEDPSFGYVTRTTVAARGHRP